MDEPRSGADGPVTEVFASATDPLTDSLRVLILGCSRQQAPDPAPLAALARYNGPSFRVLRRYLGGRQPAALALTVFVLSAEHGLIPADLPILPYNRTMTAQRARELRPQVARQIAAHIPQVTPSDLLIGCTQAYRPAVTGLVEQLPDGSTVRMAPARPGERLACLHDWLHGRPPEPAPTARALSGQPVTLSLRGVQATLTAESLLARARTAMLRQEPAAHTPVAHTPVAHAPATWAVDLGGVLVSPKWLVSLGFGVSRSAFGTSDALRVLSSLGITVHRRPA